MRDLKWNLSKLTNFCSQLLMTETGGEVDVETIERKSLEDIQLEVRCFTTQIMAGASKDRWTWRWYQSLTIPIDR